MMASKTNAAPGEAPKRVRKPACGFKVTDKGVFLVILSSDPDEADKFEFVCGKLEVAAMIRDQHSGVLSR